MWKNDLSESFGPMTVKELRQGMRKASFVYPFLVIQVIAVLAVSVELKAGSNLYRVTDPGMLNVFMLFTSGPFWVVAGVICMLLMPLTGLWLMKPEMEEANHELLQLTSLSRWRIVFGKFLTLWGLCALTFCSLLPYVVVRYMVGGVEWGHELACASTVLGGGAMLSAMAIGASAYRKTAAKLGILSLLAGSGAAIAAITLVGSALLSKGCGWFYHLTAVSAVVCCVFQSLSLARSRLRLALHPYESDPGNLMIGWLFFQPFVIGLLTATTIGGGGFLGLLGFAWVAYMLDKRGSRKAPVPNIPPVPPLLPRNG
ncbi:MAG: hypothetical protein QM627_10905 [Luteolibacter sp.]